MYERLLDKSLSPTFEDLVEYSGKPGSLWLELDKYLKEIYSAKTQIRFPYGNDYGWSCKYSVKSKHLCDIFAENGAFALHYRISDAQLESVYEDLSEYAKEICDNKYPCKGGGWLTYRVLSEAHIADAKRLLTAKL